MTRSDQELLEHICVVVSCALELTAGKIPVVRYHVLEIRSLIQSRTVVKLLCYGRQTLLVTNIQILQQGNGNCRINIDPSFPNVNAEKRQEFLAVAGCQSSTMFNAITNAPIGQQTRQIQYIQCRRLPLQQPLSLKPTLKICRRQLLRFHRLPEALDGLRGCLRCFSYFF